jgi:beta-glucosidase
MNETIYSFPDDFLWGTATGAHHVEGDLYNSWSVWEDEGGHVWNNSRHGRACEWRFGRWREDFQRMSDLNTNTHRLSVEWSRVEPEQGVWDEAVLAEYSQWIDELLARGITPMVTLHHFTNPVWLEKEGGWLQTRTVDRFARFVEKVVSVLGDRVWLWCTINEPMVYTVQAYLVGFFNPGIKNVFKFYRGSELMLTGHAAAYKIIKAHNPAAQVSIAKHIVDFVAAPPKWINGILPWLPSWVFNEAFVEAMLTGVLRFPGRRTAYLPEVAGTADYMGLNYYQRYRMLFLPHRPPFIHQIAPPDSPKPPPLWGEIYPQGIFKRLKLMYEQTRLPIYVTEIGTPTGKNGDEVRRWYIAHAVHNIWRAINYNIPVKGIYYWSLLDSFEWTAGYNPQFQFGLYGMNFQTQERTKRPSADFYGEICRAGGLSRSMVAQYVPELVPTLFHGDWSAQMAEQLAEV